MMKNKNTKKTAGTNHKKTTILTSGTDHLCPLWVFSNIDKSGIYAFDVNRNDFKHYHVLDKIIHYSSMTWAEIKQQTHDDGKSKHHILAYSSMSKAAQSRLSAKGLDEDSDNIFSFAFDNRLRIVGIKRDREFHVLWYDPEHEVCPSTKKHT